MGANIDEEEEEAGEEKRQERLARGGIADLHNLRWISLTKKMSWITWNQ
jgi:hypothetical protein